MLCGKCGNDYSLKVWRIHRERCQGAEDAVHEREETQEKGRQEVAAEDIDTLEGLSKSELVEMAEAFGVEVDKRWSKARIAEAIENG